MPLIKTAKTPKLKLRQDKKRSWESKVKTCDRKLARQNKYSVG
jgi:hypothetical protein